MFALVLLVVATAVAFWSGGPTSLDELKQLITSNPFLLAICVATFIISVIVAPHLRSNCSSSTDESYVRLIKSVMPLAPKGTNCIIRGTRTYSKTQFTISCLESSDQSSPQNFLAQPAIKSSKPSLLDKVADLQPFSQGEDPSQDTFDSAPGSSADRSGTPSPRSGGLMDSELGTAETGKPQGCWSKLKNGIHGLCPCLMKPIGRLFSCLCKPIGRLFSFLWKAIGGLFSFLWKPIGGLFSYLWKPIHGLCPCFFDTIGRWMSCFMNTIGRWLSCLMTTIGRWLSCLMNTIGRLFSFLMKPSVGLFSFLCKPIGRLFSFLCKPIGRLFSFLWKVVGGLFSFLWKPIGGLFSFLFKPIHGLCPSFFNTIGRWLSCLMNTIGKWLSCLMNTVLCCRKPKFGDDNQNMDGSYNDYPSAGYKSIFVTPSSGSGTFPSLGKSSPGQFSSLNGQPTDGSHPDQGKSGPGQFSSPNGQPTDGNISEPLKKGISNFFNGQPDDVTGYHPGEVLNEGTVPGQSKYFQPYDSSQPGEFDDANQPGNSYDSAGKPNGASRRGYQRGKCFKQIIITAILSVAVTSATIFGAIFLYKKYSS